MAIFFALCCLVCSALNDFIFKLFADKSRSRGLFAALIGVVWFGVMCFLPFNGENLQATLLWGALAGFFSITSNLLLIEAMGMQSAGVCSTVFRLNLVPVVLMAWLMLDEKISALQWLGIACAVAAILCFMTGDKDHEHRNPRLGFILVLCGALLRACMGITYKYAFINGADRAGVLLMGGAFWVIGGLLYALLRERQSVSFNRSMVRFGVLSGLCVSGIVFFMAAALQYGNAGIVLSIAQISFPLTLILSRIFLKEKITARKLAGVAAGIAAVIALSQ